MKILSVLLLVMGTALLVSSGFLLLRRPQVIHEKYVCGRMSCQALEDIFIKPGGEIPFGKMECHCVRFEPMDETGEKKEL